MLIQGQVGAPSTSITAGATPPIRQGQLGDVIVSNLHGRLYETTYRKQHFSCNLTTGTTTSAALATSFTGLMLYNPPNSTVNVSVNKIGMSFLVAFAAAAAVGVMVGQTMTPLATFSAANARVQNMFINGAPGQAVAYNSATIASAEPGLPKLLQLFGTGLTGAITTQPQIPGFMLIWKVV